MKKMLTLLALLTALSGLTVATTAPANAVWGTDVTHSANDSGYTATIKVRCVSGKIVFLSKGERTALSRDPADACSGSGAEAIWVGSQQAVRCLNNLPPYQSLYMASFGWHTLPSFASLDCYMQRPI